MNFPGRVHVHSGGLTARFCLIAAVVVSGLIALIWNVYVSIQSPLPAESLAPHRSANNGASKTLVDIIERDAGRLVQGDVLGRPNEKTLEAPFKEAVNPVKKPVVIHPADTGDYYK